MAAEDPWAKLAVRMSAAGTGTAVVDAPQEATPAEAPVAVIPAPAPAPSVETVASASAAPVVETPAPAAEVAAPADEAIVVPQLVPDPVPEPAPAAASAPTEISPAVLAMAVALVQAQNATTGESTADLVVPAPEPTSAPVAAGPAAETSTPAPVVVVSAPVVEAAPAPSAVVSAPAPVAEAPAPAPAAAAASEAPAGWSEIVEAQEEEAPAPTAKGKGKSRGKSKRGSKNPSAQPIPEELQQIPAPGGRYRGGRGRLAVVKTVSLVTGALVLAGAGVWGGAAGARALQQAPVLEITAADAARYGLDEFPVTGAAAFAERFVELCMTPALGDEAGERARVTQLQAMATSGSLAGCGVGSRAVDIAVVSAAFAGVSGEVAERESARFIDVQAVLEDGRTLAVTVPVWTDPQDPGSAFMVVGPIGNKPLPAVVDLPALPSRSADGDLGQKLTTDVFEDFFNAWGSSSSTVLARFAAPDATPAVTTGLAGSMGTPHVDAVTVPLPDEATTHVWETGETATATVQVTWTLPGADLGQVMAYRVDVVLTSTGWVVADIAGGATDQAGANPDAAAAVATAAPIEEAEDEPQP